MVFCFKFSCSGCKNFYTHKTKKRKSRGIVNNCHIRVQKIYRSKQRIESQKICLKMRLGIGQRNQFCGIYSPECELEVRKRKNYSSQNKNALKRKFEKDLELRLAEVFRRGFEYICGYYEKQVKARRLLANHIRRQSRLFQGF